MKFGTLVKGALVRRENRFCASVLVEDRLCRAHVPNSGRLQELLIPGASLYLRPANRLGRTTEYDLILVESGQFLVCIDARLPPRLIQQAWEEGRLAEFRSYACLQSEVPWGHSRLDLLFESAAGESCWVETKSVTLVQEGIARFPDAPTERGRRHVMELAHLAKLGLCAALIFVVQRPDARAFAPHDEADVLFGKAWREAREVGVRILAYACHVSLAEIVLHAPLPLAF